MLLNDYSFNVQSMVLYLLTYYTYHIKFLKIVIFFFRVSGKKKLMNFLEKDLLPILNLIQGKKITPPLLQPPKHLERPGIQKKRIKNIL